jgi:hypothetical protein
MSITSRLLAAEVFGSLVILVSLVATQPALGAKHGLAMWSLRDVRGGWSYVITSDRTEDEVLQGARFGSIGALEQRLRKLPPDTYITWRDLPPSKIVIYPPRHVITQITTVAKRRGMHLEVWPTVVDEFPQKGSQHRKTLPRDK